MMNSSLLRRATVLLLVAVGPFATFYYFSRLNEVVGIVVAVVITTLMIGSLVLARWSPKPNNKSNAIELRAKRSFRYFDNLPRGYVGYTDSVAMECTLHDDLLQRPPDKQFELVGFGLGFVSEVVDGLSNAELTKQKTFVLPLPNISQIEAGYIGWLSQLQTRGTDNAPPSTRNLRIHLGKQAAEMSRVGPIKVRFWELVKKGRGETPAAPRADLEKLVETLERAQAAGAKAAVDAIKDLDSTSGDR